MKYLFLLLLSTSAAAMEIKTVEKPVMCVIDKKPINCAYLAALIVRCPECDWKTKRI